jgi:hypothetical protein
MLDMSPAGDILSLRGDNSGRMRFLALPSRIGETYGGIDLHSESGWNSSESRWITCPSKITMPARHPMVLNWQHRTLR